MFVIKYALKSIRRSIGRNVLIGIIVFIIAVSACVAMSIQQAAKVAAAESMEGLSVSAHIYVDRKYIMENAQATTADGTTDMKSVMENMKGMSLEELQTYAGASSVKDFYYYNEYSIDSDTVNALNAADDSAQSATESTSATAETTPPGMGGGMGMPMQQQDPGQMMQQMVNQGDFMLKGYSSEAAMTGDDNYPERLTDGAMFPEHTTENKCIISDDLATYNSLKVGDTIQFCNPKNTDEKFCFEITGLYENFDDGTATVSAAADPANAIITSYEVSKALEDNSATVNTGDDEDNAFTGNVTGTYVFDSVADYDAFEAEAKELGLEDKYKVTSSDVAAYEAGLQPIENLKTFATTFLYITLIIGAVVLIVISVISIRDRKYEIGALAAMGLKKLKLSFMFMFEILTVTLVAILIGCIIGSAASVPLTNYLLESQVQQQETEDAQNQMPGANMGNNSMQTRAGDVEGDVKYVSKVGFSVDFMVILKMLLIGIALSVVSGFTSILFILRYDPKQILASRD